MHLTHKALSAQEKKIFLKLCRLNCRGFKIIKTMLFEQMIRLRHKKKLEFVQLRINQYSQTNLETYELFLTRSNL